MPVGMTWRRAHRHTWHASLGMHFVGVLIAVLWVTSPWTIALAAIPLTAIYYTLRNTVTLETQTIARALGGRHRGQEGQLLDPGRRLANLSA